MMTNSEYLYNASMDYVDGLAFGTIDPTTPCVICGEGIRHMATAYAMESGVQCRRCGEAEVEFGALHNEDGEVVR